jgi:CheY-like chemotaxis protein
VLDAELVREALQRLYDPPALGASRLAEELVGGGAIRAADGLYAALLAALEQLKPPGAAPPQSQAWRRYRYLQLRYVDCVHHEAAAADLSLSLRQASRVHQEALTALAGLLVRDPARSEPRPRRPDGEAERLAVRRPGAESAAPAAGPGEAGRLALEAELDGVGRLPPDGAVAIGEVVVGVLETLARVSAAHGATVETHLPADLPPVAVNRVALRQILLNLLLHAIPPARGQGPVTLSLAGEVAGAAVRLTLSGGAAGDESALSAARHLAQLQGGRVEVVGQGGLALRLPLGAVRTVLVVDDNPDVGDLFRRMLARSWYHPVPVRTAGRALRLAAEARPDCIVLDVVMPGQDGWEVLTTLQADARTAAIPVVVCSVLPDRELALSLGAADFLAKPIGRPALLATLDRLFAPPSR